MLVYKTTSVHRNQEHKLAISSLLKDACITNLLQVELNLEHQVIESCLVWNCIRMYYNTDHQVRTAPALSSCIIQRQHRTEHVNIDLEYEPSQCADQKHLERSCRRLGHGGDGGGARGNLQDKVVGSDPAR